MTKADYIRIILTILLMIWVYKDTGSIPTTIALTLSFISFEVQTKLNTKMINRL
jgi:hypothetical protein